MQTNLLIPKASDYLNSDILRRSITRHFPELSEEPIPLDANLLRRIAHLTGRPEAEVFSILLNDKQAERELGFPVITIDPNSLSLASNLVLPQEISAFFIPVSLGRGSITLTCRVPLVALSELAISVIDSLITSKIRTTYALPELMDEALEALRKSEPIALEDAKEKIIGDGMASGSTPYLDLEGFQGDASLNALVPVGLQRRYQIVPVYTLGDQFLTIAAAKELDIIRRSEIRSHLRPHLEIGYVLSDASQISSLIAANELTATDSTSLVGQLGGSGTESGDETELVYVDAATIGERASRNDASIIPLVDAFLAYAAKQNASDLHIAPFDTHLSVEYRVDDWKHAYPEPIPTKLAAPVISRLKYLSNIDIQRLVDPQYGRFTFRLKNVGDIEVRTTIMPTVYGDAVTLRFAPKGGRIRTLEENGMRPHEIGIIRRVVEGSSGMLLVVGPTGSGKSTTLYSILARIPTDQWEVLSAEEPPERYIPGVKQTDITRGMTYAKFLAGALRADPDYINIGETRTPDTAAQLIRAVETGHICFSTLHTAQACGAPGRMLGLDVPPYALADTLSAVIAQTLVAKVCPKCSFPVPAPSEVDIKALGIRTEWFGSRPNFVEGRGCPSCMLRGFKGRMLVAEGYTVDPSIRQLILRKEPAEMIRAAQEKQGGKTMLQQACEAAASGLVPLSKALALGGAGRE